MRSAIVTRFGTKLGVLLVVMLALGVCASSAAAAGGPGGWFTPFGATTEFRFAGTSGVTFETALGSSSPTKTSCTGTPYEILTLGVSAQERWAEEIKLTGCKSGGTFGGPCTSPGETEGIIKLNRMALQLEYLSPANHEVGVVLNYHKSGEVTTFATFSCTILGITKKFLLRGTVLAKITPVKQETNNFPVTLNGSAGKQELTEYVNAEGKNVVTKLEEEYNGSKTWEAVDMSEGGAKITTNELVRIEG